MGIESYMINIWARMKNNDLISFLIVVVLLRATMNRMSHVGPSTWN